MTLKMKQKTIGLLFAGILMLAMVLTLTSAAITFDTMPTVDPYGTSFTFKVKADVNDTYDITISDITEGSDTLIFTPDVTSFTVTNAPTINEITVIVSYDASNFNYELAKTYSTTITVKGQNTTETASAIVNIDEINFCEGCENQGNLELRIEDVNVLEGFGDDDNYWYPFDEIEVELEVENKGNWDIDDIEIEWALYTTDGNKIMDDTLNDFNLKDGKDEKITFTFKLDEDFEDFENEDAILYIKAKGTIDDNDSPYDGDDTCDSGEVNAEVLADDDFIILDDIKINGVELNDGDFEEYALMCGQEVTITADVWNIGTEDFQEVSLDVYHKELGINKIIELGDIDAFENKEISFSLMLPKEVDDGWYALELGIYDEDNDLFENSQDDKSEFEILFELSGNCGFSEPGISAELLTEAKENQEMTIKVIIKNTGSKDVSYHLNAAGFAEWAELIEVSEADISINAGESKEVLFKFMTKKESAGERFFNIEIFSDNQLITKQPVVVSIEEVKNNFKDFVHANWKLLIIGLVNLILIIAIIIVAVRTYRR